MRDNGLLLLLVLFQQIGRRSVGLAAAENLAAMQTMLQVTFGLFLVNLGLAHHRVLDQRRNRVHLFLNALGNGVVHAYDAHLPVDTRGVG